MTLNEYQIAAHRTSQPTGDKILHALCGLNAEVGEVNALFQRYHRGDITWREVLLALDKELGDVAWYLDEFITVIGQTSEHIRQMNLDKLAEREARNQIKGKGDNR